MNEPGNDLPSQPVENSETVDALRRQINLLFGGLIIVSFTLTAFLGLQARRAAIDLAAIQRPASEALKIAEQDDAAVKNTFAKLVEFGRTHPDFQKEVLSKFRLNTNSPALPAAAK